MNRQMEISDQSKVPPLPQNPSIQSKDNILPKKRTTPEETAGNKAVGKWKKDEHERFLEGT